jgi:hypothetical protein
MAVKTTARMAVLLGRCKMLADSLDLLDKVTDVRDRQTAVPGDEGYVSESTWYDARDRVDDAARRVAEMVR